jgi:thiosulfate dehydrogenase
VKTFIVGLIVGSVITPLAIYMYFASGLAPAAASAAPMPFEKMLAKKALHARIKREMPQSILIAADEANYVAGAEVYLKDCAVCHGLPGRPATAIAQGMYPKPPQLLEGKGVTDDPAGESYWKVARGIRLTGMPGFQDALSDKQMWQVSILLADSNKLSKAVQDSLRPVPVSAPAGRSDRPTTVAVSNLSNGCEER